MNVIVSWLFETGEESEGEVGEDEERSNDE